MDWSFPQIYFLQSSVCLSVILRACSEHGKMAISQHFICLLIIILISSLPGGVDGCDGYYNSVADQCRFSSPDLSYLEYVRSYWFNKAPYIVFNSTVGKFVGYTEFGIYNAEAWNTDTAMVAQMRAQKDAYCRPNAQIEINNILTQTAEPVVKLKLGKASIGGQSAILVCSAYDFYPKMIKLTWYRDGKEVTGDVISSEELADGDWYYQIHSHLEFTPKAGEKISCMVEHSSLKEPLVVHWDPSMPRPEKTKIAVGVAALVLGFIVMVAGFIYYERSSRVSVSGANVKKKPVLWGLNVDTAHKGMKSALWWLNSVTMRCDETPVKTPVK
ncbi:rano class II histocompatibility antigen, A beta chain-like isoform X1 [Engraulis encrasicolus]|uniref:rano class II histocompatibility antigen, A beta chain-like isoform X1 n=1 Tax=Engraulis encrasicolus TaxID=184585 RepID=UPI002FD656E5